MTVTCFRQFASHDKIFYFDWFISSEVMVWCWNNAKWSKQKSKVEMSSLKVGTAISIISGWKQALII